MAKKGARTWVWMIAEDKKETNYRFQTERNKTNQTEKLTIMKYVPELRRRVKFKETK